MVLSRPDFRYNGGAQSALWEEGLAQRITLACCVLGVILVLAAFMALPGQAGNGAGFTDEAELALAGKGYYYRAWGESNYSCIYCHANFDEDKLDDGYWRPANPLWNSTARRSFYNEAYAGTGDIPLARSVNTCIVAFLQTGALKLGDERMQALLAYLHSISPDDMAPPVTITRASEAPDVDGDPRRGKVLFSASCVLCHRDKGILPELDFTAETSLVFSKIRGTKGPTGSNRETIDDYPPMPFFSMERLSDQQVADILAHWDFMKFTKEQSLREEITPEEGTVEIFTDTANGEAEKDEVKPAEPVSAAGENSG